MSACPDREALLQALADGELDAANALALEAHVKGCPGCAAALRTLRAVRARLAEADLATPAPAALRARVAAMLDAEERSAAPPRKAGWWASLAAAWSLTGVMTAAAAALLMVQLSAAPSLVEAQLVASHLRSLQPGAGRLIDVATSDRHVVRPWFNGRIDYAPPVPDLAAQGFPLAGGRLDYADGRPIAALVYRHGAHVISLFAIPERGLEWRLPGLGRDPAVGYDVVRWRHGGLEYWAVSDVEGGELDAFRRAFEAAAG
jgi:anti-sigma factor RsiW